MIKKVALYTAGLAVLMTTSCQDHSNLYDSDYASAKKQLEYAESFPVQNIDPTQDWNLFTTADVQVTVNEDWGETYTVKVYTANPLDETSGALLLAKGEVKSGETFSTKIDVAKAQDVVWVARVDSHNRRLAKPIYISNGKIEASFGSSTTRSVDTRADDSFEYQAAPYTDDQVQALIANGTDLTTVAAGTTLEEGVYYIPKEAKVDWNWYMHANQDVWGTLKVFVLGEVTMSGDQKKIEQYSQLYVAKGGVFNLNAYVDLNNCGQFHVLPGGTLKGTGSLTFSNGTEDETIYLGGKVDIDFINGNIHSKIYNADTLNLKSMVGSDGVWYNAGKITTGSINTGTIINACSLLCTGDVTLSNLTLSDNAQFVCEGTLNANQGNWNLGHNSLLQAKGETKINKAQFIGPSSDDYALMDLNNITYWNYWYGDGGYVTNNIWFVYNTCYSDWFLSHAINGLDSEATGNGNATASKPGETNFISYSDANALGSCAIVSIEREDGPEEDDSYDYCYYAYEDLGSIGDFDFNDVVLRVSKTETEYQYKVEIVAAGGMLPVAVYFEGAVLWDDIHGANGYNDSNVINVGAKKNTNYPSATITSTKQEAFNQLSTLIISVSEANSTNLTLEPLTVNPITEMGAAPQCLIIPAGWSWPTENTNLTWVHGVEGHSFAEWVQDKTKATDWYKYISEDYESYVITPAK
jgi:hypothetical protein